MTPMLLSDIARAVNGRLVGDDVRIDAVRTDTRALTDCAGRGVLFLALKGGNFDGHDYIAQAAALGARAALVSRLVDAALPQVVVADTELALAQLAAALQRGRRTRVLAVTGSNGKTSVKTLVLAILERAVDGRADAFYANPGNRNNQIGLPLAVIDAPDAAEYAIYEMGAGQPGDIAYLTDIARPDVSLVNNIAPAHLERMGSLLGIADTKAAIYDALADDGVAVINADDAFAPYFAERAQGHRIVRFGLDANADVTARDIALDDEGSRFTLVAPQGEAAIALAMPGRHNVSNALAAASLTLGAGIAFEVVVAGLNAARPVAGRLITHTLAPGVTLVDDSYNANPGSLNAAIDTLAASSGERWLVLGDMRELGEDAVALHAEVGRRVKASGVARLYALGTLCVATAEAFGEGARVFDAHEEVADALRADLAARVETASALRVLVKGSRGSAMDKIVKAMLSTGVAGGGEGEPHAA